MNIRNSNELKVNHYEDGVELFFNILALPESHFNSLMALIKRNKTARKIYTPQVYLDKNDVLHIYVLGIEGHIDEFLQLIESELAVTDIFNPQQKMSGSLAQKFADEMQKVFAEPS